MDIRQIIAAYFISAAVVLLAYRRRSLSKSGAVGAFFVGIIIFGFGGPVWGILLGLFFISSSLLSHFKEDEKLAAAEKFDKGHQRDMGQVLANGGLGSLIAFLSLVVPSTFWFPLFIGIMATVTADTWATELGTLSKSLPRLITNGRRVETGTSGGVSLLGTVVSLVGGLIIGLSAGLLDPDLTGVMGALIGGIGGLAGSLFDSFLGATVQQIFYCDVCRKDTERRVHKCGHETRPLRGWGWLNNDLVNLFASIFGGFVAAGLWLSI